jgi:hypothetical protein
VMSLRQNHDLLKLIFASAVYPTKYTRLERVPGPDDEPTELCRLTRPGVRIGQKANNSEAKLLIIFQITNLFDLPRLMR